MSDRPTPMSFPKALQYFFQVQHFFKWPHVWIGDLETWWLHNELQKVDIQYPMYVCGLPRAGTTILMKILSEHEDSMAHRYIDQMSAYCPALTNAIFTAKRIPPQLVATKERIHKDGLQFGAFEPEALEEVIWMTEFPRVHDETISNIISRDTSNRNFEYRYDAMIKKLLYTHSKKRYVAKNNYLIPRQEYLLKLHPDARMFLCIRHPAAHIASTIKSHEIITSVVDQLPFFKLRMSMLGHFEFGPILKFMNLGDGTAEKLRAVWSDEDVARGRTPEGRVKRVRCIAMYWATMYKYMHDMLRSDSKFRNASLVVRHEDMCAKSEMMLEDIFNHARLEGSSAAQVKDKYKSVLKTPDYYKPAFTEEEFRVVRQETEAVGALFGYDKDTWTQYTTGGFLDCSATAYTNMVEKKP